MAKDINEVVRSVGEAMAAKRARVVNATQSGFNAASAGWVDELATAIAGGADVDALDGDGYSMAMLAAMATSPACLRLLVQKGADLARRSVSASRGETVVGQNVFDLAARAGSVACIELLLAAGCDVDARGVNGSTATSHAALKGCAPCVALLAKAGANLTSLGYLGSTIPLHVAASMGHVDVIYVVDAHGGDLDAKTDSGITAAMTAAMSGNEECVKVLADLGADLGLVNNVGQNAEVIATFYGFPSLALVISGMLAAQKEAGALHEACPAGGDRLGKGALRM